MHRVLTSFVWRCNIKETSAIFTWKRWEIGQLIGTQWLYIHYCGMLISETGTSINSPAWDRESHVLNSLCVTKRKLWCGKKNPCLMQSVKGFPLCVCAITSSLPLPPTCQKSLLPQAQLVAACWPNILWAFTANRPKACTAVWRQTDTVHTFSSIHSWGKMQLVNLELGQLSHTVVHAVC